MFGTCSPDLSMCDFYLWENIKQRKCVSFSSSSNFLGPNLMGEPRDSVTHEVQQCVGQSSYKTFPLMYQITNV